jgi:hypothetical protein
MEMSTFVKAIETWKRNPWGSHKPSARAQAEQAICNFPAIAVFCTQTMTRPCKHPLRI